MEMEAPVDVEDWRKINEFPNYSVSNHGRVRNDKFGRMLTPTKHCTKKQPNYINMRVGLSHNTYCVVRNVSRLVAQAFIPPVEGRLTVDHIDIDTTNNHASNLRWADRKMQNENRTRVRNIFIIAIRRRSISSINSLTTRIIRNTSTL